MDFSLFVVLVLGCMGIVSTQRASLNNCALIQCGIPNCPDYYTPPGGCCPVCPTRGDKPGRCPSLMGMGICVEGCRSDFECHGNQKCCSNGCGHTCRRPVGRPGFPVRDCSEIMCIQRYCIGQYTPPGACCPVCPPQGGNRI